MNQDRVLLIDKPLHWTSFDVIKKLRTLLQIRKIGHAGTLDPLATGLLIVCTGKKTKEISQYQGLPKTYEGTFVIGKTTPSYDLETDFDSVTPWEHITLERVVAAVEQLQGTQQQLPPLYSAIKVGGKRAYAEVRKGKSVTLLPRTICITEFTTPKVVLPVIHFRIVCSKGTYIRSIAHDLGKLLGVGAYLATLRRTHIGAYAVEEAVTIASLAKNAPVRLEDFLKR